MAESDQSNKTTRIVRHAMKIVSPQVREPKVVRDGTVKKPAKQNS